jgi:3-deoxy-7-phosphoheptulonate synthase
VSNLPKTDNVRIVSVQRIPAPGELVNGIAITPKAAETTYSTRQAIQNILHGKDDRVVVICGPCSIHDVDAAIEYATRLKPLIDEYHEELVLIMRVYFEKPRTTIGWKGLINDPHLDNSFKINEGLEKARQLLLDLNDMGVPAGTEYLDMLSPQYYSDLISWGAVGARTTESQGHRELASGLSCPVGFKNGTDGNVQIAVDAIRASSQPHHFLSRTKDDHSAIYETSGNDSCHLILRGGSNGPNYYRENIDSVCLQLESAGLRPQLMVDLSHANSLKKADRQVLVGEDISRQITDGESRIMGMMIESHLVAGRQNHVPGQPLVYGQSITDACVDFSQTETILSTLVEAIRARRAISN